MRLRLRFATLALAAAVIAVGPGHAPAAQTVQRDWTQIVEASEGGGFRIGNPDAPLQLVEYGSLTCHHCAHFEEEGVPLLLQNYVRSGKVSFEFRNYVRDSADLTAAMLSRCAGAARFFPFTKQILANQEGWIAKLRALPQAEWNAIDALPLPEQLVRIAAIAGFDRTASAHGISADKVKTCLGNDKAIARLTEMHRIANEQYGLRGTPAFLINGRPQAGVHDWSALQPLLAAAGG